MKIELKEIDKGTLKVGDFVGIAREVQTGWGSSFRHKHIIPTKITRITPKRTKFFTERFGEHDKREIFYECDINAGNESYLAKLFDEFQDGVFELGESKRKNELAVISDEDLPEVAEHMKAITEILEKYRKE